MSEDEEISLQLRAELAEQAAQRLADALQDIYNIVGEIPEVRSGYQAVEREVGQWHRSL